MHRDSWPQHHMQPCRRCCSRGRAIYTVLQIVVTLILLPTTAFATPPDPSWIAGIYDGADGDDIVTLVYETSGCNAAGLSHVPPLSSLTEALFASVVHRDPSCQSTGSPRSPSTVAFSCLFNSSPDYTLSPLSLPRSIFPGTHHEAPSVQTGKRPRNGVRTSLPRAPQRCLFQSLDLSPSPRRGDSQQRTA